MLLAANSSQQNLMSPVVLPASVRWNSTDPFGVVHSHAPFTVAPSANGFPGEMFGQADVVAQFSNIQLSLNNNAHDHPFDIPALRAYCQREDVSVFAKSLAEYIAGMDHPSSRFICDTSTRFLLVIFLCVAIVGFIGNFLTFLVIFRTPSLHSPTNFFLASLAVSDLLLILVGVPFDILFLWQRKSFDPPIKYFCESTSTLISWFTFNSILTIVSLTGERLVAICYPFSLRPWFHRNSVLWLILVLWLISFFPSIFIGIQFKLVIQDFCGRTHQHPNGVGSKCDFIMGGDDYTFELMLCLTFMLPVFFIVYCYVKIYNTLNEATFNSYHLNATSGNGGGGVANSQMSSQHQTLLPIGTQQPPVDVPNSPSPVDGERGFFFNNSIRISSRTHSFGQQFARDSFVRNSHRSQQAQKTVMKMLIMIAALFFICYLPYHLERLIVKYEKSGGCAERQACLWLYHGTGLLQYISAALNPIIYNVMSRRFRREFQRICYRIVRKEVKPEMRIRANTVPFQNQLLQMTPLNRLL